MIDGPTALLAARAPFPANVRAFTTLRHGMGESAAPFDSFNLGNFRSADGDDPAVVARNRAELVNRFGLPSAPCWLNQVHGTRVLRFADAGGPHPNPLPQAGEGAGAVLPERALPGLAQVGRLAGGPHPNPLPQAGEGAGAVLPERALPGLAQTGLLAGGPHPGPLRQAGEGAGAVLPERALPGLAQTGLLAGEAACLPLPLAGEGRGEGTPGNDPDAEPEADAAVTSTPGVVLAILTADCLPVVFAARDGREVAAAHAGWKGLANGMLEATVAAMRSRPSDVVAWLGPAAGPQAYEVGVEVYEAFVLRDAAAVGAFVATRPGHWRVDLYALARMRLQAAGLAAEAIHGGDLCTISDPQRFFSHRRDRRSGRMATLVWFS